MAKNFEDALISWNGHIAKKYGYEVCRWESSDGAINYGPKEMNSYPIASVRVNGSLCPDWFSLMYEDMDEYIEMSFSEQGKVKNCYFHPGKEDFPGTVANILSILHMLDYLKEEDDEENNTRT